MYLRAVYVRMCYLDLIASTFSTYSKANHNDRPKHDDSNILSSDLGTIQTRYGGYEQALYPLELQCQAALSCTPLQKELTLVAL